MTKPLTGKVALVTGGSRGLGAATAKALAEQGADVVISYVHAELKAHAVIDYVVSQGVRGAAIQADQADGTAVQMLIDSIIAKFGRLDIVINNASIDEMGTVDDPQRDNRAFDRFWAVAMTGLTATVRAASKVLSDHGRIVMVGSNLGSRVGVPGLSDLAAVKGAIDGYSRGVARDLAPRSITVNVVHAGFMKTDINAHMRDGLAPLIERLCFPRFGLLEEVVAPILFLASPAASYITGTSIDADGGYNA
ncbi:SDR family NAD(P)-dependent oxidoreductase [Pseudomonas sp. NPDC090203]|uniref:SDR family NAD(P)-dependent oxidoreductase n=1 Tax=Pseudomonas sp. NPDC090203 TaxID=3364477 RepID=UPI0038303E57